MVCACICIHMHGRSSTCHVWAAIAEVPVIMSCGISSSCKEEYSITAGVRLPCSCEGTSIGRCDCHILTEGIDAVCIGCILMQAYAICTTLRKHIRSRQTIRCRRIRAKGPIVMIGRVSIRCCDINCISVSGICPCSIEMARRCRRWNSYILTG